MNCGVLSPEKVFRNGSYLVYNCVNLCYLWVQIPAGNE